jgi:hypothetical protein
LAGLETGSRLVCGVVPLCARCGTLQASGSAVGQPGDDVAGSGRSKETLRGRRKGRPMLDGWFGVGRWPGGRTAMVLAVAQKIRRRQWCLAPFLAGRQRRRCRERGSATVLKASRASWPPCMRQGRLALPLAPTRGRSGPRLGRDGPSPGCGARSIGGRRLHGSVLGPPRSFTGFRTSALACFDAWQDGRRACPVLERGDAGTQCVF